MSRGGANDFAVDARRKVERVNTTTGTWIGALLRRSMRESANAEFWLADARVRVGREPFAAELSLRNAAICEGEADGYAFRAAEIAYDMGYADALQEKPEYPEHM